MASESFDRPLSIVGSFNKAKYTRVDAERTVNMYPVIYGKQGESALFSFPGYKEIIELKEVTSTRASIVSDGAMYWVCGDGIFKISSSLVSSRIGTLTTFSGHVGVAANVNQIIFVDGAYGYIYTKATGVFQRITSAGFPSNPVDVVYLDGFFFAARGNSPTFYQSNPNDGLIWDAQKFASITTQPDVIVAMAVLNRRLFIFGNTVTEIWYNAGAPTVTVVRDSNLILPYGCASADTVEVDYGMMFFMASQSNGPNQVMMTDGTMPRKISNPNMENEISNFKNPSDAFATIFKLEGQLFYTLSFTKDQKTYAYNATVPSIDWFEADELPGSRHIIQTHLYFNNKHYIGSYKDGSIYELSDSYYDNDGTTMCRLRITERFFDPSYKKISIDWLEIDCLRGLGHAHGDDSDPILFLYVSIDGGITFKAHPAESTGRQGNYSRRVMFSKLGAGYDFVFKLEYYNRTEWAIIGANVKGSIER